MQGTCSQTRLFARATLVGAGIDPTSAQRSGDVDRRRLGSVAGSYRPGLGSQPNVVDELGGIKVDKHAAGTTPVDDVAVPICAWLVDAPLWLSAHKGDDRTLLIRILDMKRLGAVDALLCAMLGYCLGVGCSNGWPCLCLATGSFCTSRPSRFSQTELLHP
jgi:hypothetical protein